MTITIIDPTILPVATTTAQGAVIIGSNLSLSGSVLTAKMIPDVIVEDQRAAGTGGAPTAVSAWTTLPVNTFVRNTIGATLASGVVTLPAGTYFIRGWGAFFANNSQAYGVMTRLYNNTDAVSVAGGSLGGGRTLSVQNYSARDGDIITPAPVTITASKGFVIQYYAATASSFYGLNALNVNSINETWSRLEIYKVA